MFDLQNMCMLKLPVVLLSHIEVKINILNILCQKLKPDKTHRAENWKRPIQKLQNENIQKVVENKNGDVDLLRVGSVEDEQEAAI